MNCMHKKNQRSFAATLSGIALLTAGCLMMNGSIAQEISAANLAGTQEVPANLTSASGTSTIRITDDMSVTGVVTFSGMEATAAHIHEAAKGSNGPVIVTLEKTSDNSFAVPANAKLTYAQYDSYKAGNLYVNVHSATYPDGEIRTQLRPN